MPKDSARQRQISILLRVPVKFADRLQELAARWSSYLETSASGQPQTEEWANLLDFGRTRQAGKATIVKEAMIIGLPLIEAKLQEFEKPASKARKVAK